MLKNTRKWLHCASGHLMLPERFSRKIQEVAITPIGPTETLIVPIDILTNRYLKSTLRIDYKQRFHVSVEIMEPIWNIFRRFRDFNFRAISHPNVKNKRRHFAYKNYIWGKKVTFAI